MRYIEEFHKKEHVLPVLNLLKKETQPHKLYRIMEFCGGHTHSFIKSGLIDLLPKEIELVHGPGCPVCVLPSEPIDCMIRLLEKDPNIILTTYGDLFRVPAYKGDSLQKAKGRGLPIYGVYSPIDAYKIALKYPDKKIIFLAIGFETTIPPTLAVLDKAIKEQRNNFFIYCHHLNTAAALGFLLQQEALSASAQKLSGFVGPGHVSVITGADFFNEYAQKFKKPIAISGFTPYDLVSALWQLIKQINRNEHKVTIQYSRAVTAKGNGVCQSLMNQYLTNRPHYTWRGLGRLDHSAFTLKEEYDAWNAEVQFPLEKREVKDLKHCICPQILRGEKKPTDCRLFGKFCNPTTPSGPCMVSGEGACSAYYQAGRYQNPINTQ